jgi:hypothetical protein
MQTIENQAVVELLAVNVEQTQQVIHAVELLDSQLAMIGGGFGGIPMF